MRSIFLGVLTQKAASLLINYIFNEQKTTYEKDNKDAGQQIKILIDKLSYRMAEFPNKAGNYKKT